MFENLEKMEQKEKKPTDYSGLIILAVTLPVAVVFKHFGKFDVGMNAGLALAIFLLVARIYWKTHRTHVWFWVLTLAVLALHVPLILRIQWPHRWIPKVELLPIAVADMYVYVGAIWLVEKLTGKTRPVEEA